jgi:hypothetical protein
MRAIGLILVVLVAACSSQNNTARTVPGSATVAGILLVPAERSLREACARAAAVGGFTVPCPRLIIQHRAPEGEGCPTKDLAYAGGKDCLEDSAAGSSTAPSRRDAFTYLQNDIVLDGALHLWIVGVKADSRLAPFRTGCVGSERSELGPDLGGVPTMWVECSDGGSMHSGHVLLRWSKDSVIYAVSLHGHTSANREVELAIAQSIEYIDAPRYFGR